MLLAISLCLSFSVSASNLPVEYVYEPDMESAVAYNDFWVSMLSSKGAVAVKNVASSLVFRQVGPVSRQILEGCVSDYNNGGLETALVQSVDAGIVQFIVNWLFDYRPQAKIDIDDANGIYRLRDIKSGRWITNARGEFPYCPVDEFHYGAGRPDGTGDTPAQDIYTKPGTANKFVGVRTCDQNAPVVVSYDILSAACVSLNDQGIACSLIKMPINGVKFWVIYQLNSSDGSYYCNSLSRPFVANVEPTVTDNKFDYIVNIDDSTNDDHSTVINDSQIIDLTNGILNMITENGDRISYNIDNVTYDFDNRSYTVNAYDYTYNITNNYYEYNYYTYNISYTYNNTYVTYIGSTAEYQPKEYELYYELPDGRSSADLTAEDIAGLSFEFYDCVNYAKSATDTSLRALYHFDGDTDDSSFFSTQGAFTWNKGASITYMESNAFNGALYLDEKEHDFIITLPSGIGSGDFTLQWRYYQNAAVTSTNNDNYVMFGSTKLLGWSEQYLYSMGTSQIATGLSVGTWQELALVRSGSTVYIYHNGIVAGSMSCTAFPTDKITFHFGASSRAYSMLDELRFVNFPIAEGGAPYTPTSVPYDTNSVLVLPGGAVPIADEYWKWDTTYTPRAAIDMTTGLLAVPPAASGRINYWNASDISTGAILCASQSEVSVCEGFVNICSAGSFLFSNGTSSLLHFSGTGLGVCLGSSFYDRNEKITITVVDRDLNRYSLTVVYPRSNNSATTSMKGGTLRYVLASASDNNDNRYYTYSFLSFENIPATDIIYIEVTPGTQVNTNHEFVNCVYSSDDVQPNTAAVQSDIPINGYTVGGVRPTFPARGDVWFPVNGSRISECYIYNGRAWEETNARWYTGKRWIPIYAFDIVTLEDMWDISDAPDVVPSINSEQGFWNWWQGAWLDFRGWLSSAWGSGGSSGGGSGSVDDSTFEPVPPPDEATEGSSWSFLDLLVAIKDGAWSITVGTVKAVFGGVSGIVTAVGSIGDYYDAYDADSPDNVFGITNYGGDDIWD